ncbi:hypothetical protein GIB67_028194, partial [Kingdonia uniflora]
TTCRYRNSHQWETIWNEMPSNATTEFLSSTRHDDEVSPPQPKRAWFEKTKHQDVSKMNKSSFASADSCARSPVVPIVFSGSSSESRNARGSSFPIGRDSENSEDLSNSKSTKASAPRDQTTTRDKIKWRNCSGESLERREWSRVRNPRFIDLKWSMRLAERSKEELSDSHGQSTVQDSLVESTALLQALQEALEKEIHMFAENGKERVTLHGLDLNAEFVFAESEVNKPDSTGQLHSEQIENGDLLALVARLKSYKPRGGFSGDEAGRGINCALR